MQQYTKMIEMPTFASLFYLKCYQNSSVHEANTRLDWVDQNLLRVANCDYMGTQT